MNESNDFPNTGVGRLSVDRRRLLAGSALGLSSLALPRAAAAASVTGGDVDVEALSVSRVWIASVANDYIVLRASFPYDETLTDRNICLRLETDPVGSWYVKVGATYNDPLELAYEILIDDAPSSTEFAGLQDGSIKVRVAEFTGGTYDDDMYVYSPGTLIAISGLLTAEALPV